MALGNRAGLKPTTTCSRGVTDKDLTLEMTRGRMGQSKNLAQNTWMALWTKVNEHTSVASVWLHGNLVDGDAIS